MTNLLVHQTQSLTELRQLLEWTCSVLARLAQASATCLFQMRWTQAQALWVKARTPSQQGRSLLADLLGTSLHTHTHTHLTALFKGTTQVTRYQKSKTNLDFTEARDIEWQWHQLDHMQVCTSLQTDNHASTPPLSFFTGRMPFLPPNQQCQSTEGKMAHH